jgi:hypothetical protein
LNRYQNLFFSRLNRIDQHLFEIVAIPPISTQRASIAITCAVVETHFDSIWQGQVNWHLTEHNTRLAATARE